jgi:hypothetical protein
LLLVVALVLRAALPLVVRSQLVKQANQAVAGSVEVRDVDLWLMRGAVALNDVVLRGEDAPPSAPPLVALHRFYVNIGWWSLLRQTIRLQNVELDGLAVNLERRKDGTFVLPALRPTPPAAAPEEPAKPAEPGKPWNVVLEHGLLRTGRLGLQDFVVDPPTRREIVLDGLKISSVSVQHGPDAQPGSGLVQLRFGDGGIVVGTRVVTQEDGFAIHATIDVRRLPLDHLQMHVPELGWSDLAGRMDAHLVVSLAPKSGPRIVGSLALDGLRIEVPGAPEPALAWRRFEVKVEKLDLLERSAVVDSVALDGGLLLVDPRAPMPLRLLSVRRVSPAAPAAPPAAPAAPWTWSVGKVELTETTAKVFLEPPPLELVVTKATVTGLSSKPGSTAEVSLDLRHDPGTVGLKGRVRLDPLGAKLDVHLDALGLGPLLAAVTTPVVLPGGVLSGDLAIAAEEEPVVVSGNLSLADLAVKPREGADFALGWKVLELGIHELRVPGVLPGAPPAAGPLRVDLEKLRLAAPNVLLTRAPEGLVLPGGAPATSAPPPPAPPAATAPPPPPQAPPARVVQLTLADLDVSDGQVTIVDRSVKPFYRGDVTAIALRAHGLRYPEGSFDDFTLNARAPGDAPVSLTGKRDTRGTVTLEAHAERLPLAQANPYVTPSGYSIATGALSFGTKVGWGAQSYRSETHVKLDDFDLAGAEGDTLFAQSFGLPLTLALALLRDVSGVITLDVPVTGDRTRGASVDVKAVALQALGHALVNTLASPLKLLGAVTAEGGRVQAFTPEPIGFRAGKATVADDAWWRVNQLAGVLASYPALRFALRGNVGPDDVRALQDAAVLADLQASKGFAQSLKNLASIRERGAIRDYLVARDAGKPVELDADRRATLDKWAAEHSISDADLTALAGARAERLRTLLADDYGVSPDRFHVGEPQVDRAQGRSAVAVALGSRG